MELTITQRRDNPILDRTEVHFSVTHPAEATPSRADLRKAVAAAVNAKNATVIVDWARSHYGRTVTDGYAKVYASKERAMELETIPILIRNGLVAEEAKPKAPPAEEAPPKEEAPKAPAKEAKKEEPPKEKKAKPSKGKAEEPAEETEKPAKGAKPEKAAPPKKASKKGGE